MPKQKRDSDYSNQNSSGLYSKDSLDHYNEDLSKKAVGSIFSNIERGTTEDEHEELNEDIVIDTNFNITNNKVRKELVGRFFSEEDDASEEKRRPKQARPQQVREQKRTPNQRPQSSANSALVRDDDTISAKFVTRGNHQPVTPAMAARRKNVTMMESQRMPVITEAEIKDYKKQNAEKAYAYVNGESKDTTPVDYDDFINNDTVTSEQKELVELLRNEASQKEQELENTLHRLSEKNKHYHEIIQSTNQRLQNTDDNFNTTPNKNPRHNTYLKEEFEESFEDSFDEDLDALNFDNSFSDDNTVLFGEALNNTEDFVFAPADLDYDFEETLTSNHKGKQSKPFIPSKNLTDTQAKMRKVTTPEPTENFDYYDLETDTYVSKKSKYNTGEVKKINDTTIATEISIDELDEFVFDNYDTADMEYLRKTIKEKTKAQKMQNLDNKIQEFERTHRDFNSKSNVPPKTTPKQRPVQQTEHPIEAYEYKKTRQRTERLATVDTGSHKAVSQNSGRYSTNRFETDDYDTGSFDIQDYDTGSQRSIEDTGSYNTGRVSSRTGRVASSRTARIATVDLENEPYDDYSTKFNISLILNIIIGVGFVVVLVMMFMKNSTLNSTITQLEAIQSELSAQSSTITELQMEVDYYKNLYEATEEGQLSLQTPENGEATEGDAPAENSDSTTYTVQSGDTLSSISRKFYGTSGDYQKIIDANKLSTDSLQLGQELIIPN